MRSNKAKIEYMRRLMCGEIVLVPDPRGGECGRCADDVYDYCRKHVLEGLPLKCQPLEKSEKKECLK